LAVSLVVGQNSYIDIEYATGYFSERLFSDPWDNANDDDKAKALIMATKKIDRQPLVGRKATAAQGLECPRSIYSYNKNFFGDCCFVTQDGGKYITNSQGWIVENEVSENIKNAVCEEALALLDFGNDKRLKLQKQGVKSFSVSKMSETYSGTTRKLLSEEAREFLKPYLAGSIHIV
jgi:hypothetical protein